MDGEQQLADAQTLIATAKLLRGAMIKLLQDVASTLDASQELTARAKGTRPTLPRGNVIIPFPSKAITAALDEAIVDLEREVSRR